MTYRGSHISGQGNPAYLTLIDKSFGALRSSPTLPNLKMLYKSETDMFSEGFIWGSGWWIQNSYGFTMGAIPLLDDFWFRILQNSYDAFWKRIGDGKRIGADNGNPPTSITPSAPQTGLWEIAYSNTASSTARATAT